MSQPPPLPPRRNLPRRESAAAVAGDHRDSGDTAKWIVAAAIIVILLLLLLIGGLGLRMGVGRGTQGSSRQDGRDTASRAGDQRGDQGDSFDQGGPAADNLQDAAVSTDSRDAAPAADSVPPSPPNDADLAEPEPPAPRSGPAGISVGDGPANRRTVAGGTFFGIRADGQRFVYVIDCSSSMDGRPLERAKEELFASLKSLLPSQEFYIIFYASETYPMYHPAAVEEFATASDEALTLVKTWLPHIAANGGTEPESALLIAIGKKPDAVFFLTDGAIPDTVPAAINAANASETPVHTICFTNRAGEDLLKQIAAENHGDYHFVP
jgi:hypothetical protein